MDKKVLLIDTMHPLFSELLIKEGFLIVDGTQFSKEEVLSVLDQFQGVALRSRILFDQECINAAKNLKFIARAGAGMESIDVDCAEKNNICCINSPEGNRDALAEHAMGMILSLLNRLHIADKQVRNGNWIREGNRGYELGGKTIGILGYGNMGQAFAKRLKGFDVQVLAYDKYKTNYTDKFAVEASMESLFAETDILSLHLPLTDETNYLIDNEFFNAFHKPIYLINTARGKIVDTSAVVQNLKSGKVLGAALDVLEFEKYSFENLLSNQKNIPTSLSYLLKSEQVILSPHIAGWTHESNEKIASVLVDKILKFYQSLKN